MEGVLAALAPPAVPVAVAAAEAPAGVPSFSNEVSWDALRGVVLPLPDPLAGVLEPDPGFDVDGAEAEAGASFCGVPFGCTAGVVDDSGRYFRRRAIRFSASLHQLLLC